VTRAGRTGEAVTLSRAIPFGGAARARLPLVGKVWARSGRAQQLEELSRAAIRLTYNMAYIHAGLGQQDTAMDWLERAYKERRGAVYGVKARSCSRPALAPTVHAAERR